MQIKVCGLNNGKNMAEMDNLWVDFVGMIFYSKSPRFVEKTEFPKTIASKVGVFVNASPQEIIKQAEKHGFFHVQLHGNEPLSVVKELYKKGFQVLKAFSVSEEIDYDLLKKYEPYCSYFLLDAKGKQPGGNGVKFNWDLLENYSLQTPFFLSGGIGPKDYEALKKIQNPSFAGVDLNSGFETEPGLKNTAKLNTFIHEIRK